LILQRLQQVCCHSPGSSRRLDTSHVRMHGSHLVVDVVLHVRREFAEQL
jgi:hypothetical protein